MTSPRLQGAVRAGLLVCLSFATVVAEAATVSYIGAGSAVTSIDRSATFDSLISDGTPLSSYTEGLLGVSTPGTSLVGFTAFTDTGPGQTDKFYYAGGNNSFVTITASDGIDIFGVELRVGHGFTGVLDTSVVWEAYSNNILTGSGQFNTTRGTVIGWSDAAGFDELRVGASVLGYTSFGDSQAIAIDDLNVQISAVPLPAAAWLFGSGVLGLIGIGRRRRRAG